MESCWRDEWQVMYESVSLKQLSGLRALYFVLQANVTKIKPQRSYNRKRSWECGWSWTEACVFNVGYDCSDTSLSCKRLVRVHKPIPDWTITRNTSMTLILRPVPLNPDIALPQRLLLSCGVARVPQRNWKLCTEGQSCRTSSGLVHMRSTERSPSTHFHSAFTLNTTKDRKKHQYLIHC